MSEAPASAFRLANVTKRFGDFVALNSVSLNVAAGERIGIIGPSGAGKTTLLKLLGGTLQPTTGSLLVGGHMVGKLKKKELLALRRETGSFIRI